MQNLNNIEKLHDFALIISSINPDILISEDDLYDINYVICYEY